MAFFAHSYANLSWKASYGGKDFSPSPYFSAAKPWATFPTQSTQSSSSWRAALGLKQPIEQKTGQTQLLDWPNYVKLNQVLYTMINVLRIGYSHAGTTTSEPTFGARET